VRTLLFMAKKGATRTMKEPDLDTVRRLIETWMQASIAGDPERVLGLMSRDIVFMIPGHLSLTRTSPDGKIVKRGMNRYRFALAAFAFVLGCSREASMSAGKGTKRRATGHTQVKTYEPTTYDEVEEGPSLLEVRVTETFTGDIEGEGSVRVIQAASRKDG